MCLGRSPFHYGNVALNLNPSSGYVSPQFHIVFDNAFSLTPSLRSNTMLNNWTDLVPKLSESVYNENIDSSKMWFEQHYPNPLSPESRFAATFNSTASALTNNKSTSEGATVVNKVSEGATSSIDEDFTVLSLNSKRELLSIYSKILKLSV